MADAGEEEQVSASSYGFLDTTHVSDECWMIRIPQKLAELWEKAPEGTNLGELIFTKGGTAREGGKTNTVKPSLNVQVSEDLVNQPPQGADDKKPPAHIPVSYSLQAMTKKIPSMHPFTRNPNNGSVKLLGTVTRTANMQVEQQDSNYRAMLKDRLVATNITTSRYVKPAEATESVVTKQSSSTAAVGPASNKKGFVNAVFQYGKRMLEAAQESSLAQQQQPGPSKKARQFSPDQPMRSVVFELFGQQQYWTVKDLKAAAVAGGATAATTKRAEAEIRDILREIGDYHRSGDHKNMWELRKEFQQQS